MPYWKHDNHKVGKISIRNIFRCKYGSIEIINNPFIDITGKWQSRTYGPELTCDL